MPSCSMWLASPVWSRRSVGSVPTAPFVVREVGLSASRLERASALPTQLRAYPREVASR